METTPTRIARIIAAGLIGIALFGLGAGIALIDDAEPERAQPVPAQSANAETVPAETVPVETVPVETVPAETVSVETVPDETVPSPTYPEAGVPPHEPTAPPAPQYPGVLEPLADLMSGELLGHPLGASATEVVASLEAEFGSIDDHGGWYMPCDIEELSVSSGGFWVRFERSEDGDRMTGWQALTDGPAADRITLPDDATPSMSMAELSTHTGGGQALTVVIDWDLSRLDMAGPGANPWFIGTADIDDPADTMGHGRTDPSCYDI